MEAVIETIQYDLETPNQQHEATTPVIPSTS